ncbi:MAG TPA: aldo/keto reductase [Dehalococcoidia bacterium]|jgi:aryl-alcohol dehydrogenase-like predicted oxidoreductase|nr:aldo/keto reductase [Dehalococcoidia bacterium]HIK89884.1 aldo/keto reductase [Dehalococcoidia bacterium]
MQTVPFGNTGFNASRLGVGLSEIGSQFSISDQGQATTMLNTALDAGINFLDTSACYGISEILVGKGVAERRDDYFLATKAGHIALGAAGEEWTYQTVVDSIDRSLRLLQTDHVDLVQLHSCGIDVLEKGDVIRALQEAEQAGKTRFIGYSGDNEAAHWAVDSGLFATLQTSYNIVEQRARTSGLLEKATDRGMGTIIKRPIAGGVWGKSRPEAGIDDAGHYNTPYLLRAKAVRALGPIEDEPADGILTALGYTLGDPNANVAIVGTTNPSHMATNISQIDNDLPIPDSVITELKQRFEQLDKDWTQRT